MCGADVVHSVGDLLGASDVVITATPAAKRLFAAEAVRRGTQIVVLGADWPEKQELQVKLFAWAAHVLCDDIRQCASFSDSGKAVNAGALAQNRVAALGKVLGGDVVIARKAGDIMIADLTGLAVQDIEIATWFGAKLG